MNMSKCFSLPSTIVSDLIEEKTYCCECDQRIKSFSFQFCCCLHFYPTLHRQTQLSFIEQFSLLFLLASKERNCILFSIWFAEIIEIHLDILTLYMSTDEATRWFYKLKIKMWLICVCWKKQTSKSWRTHTHTRHWIQQSKSK